MAIATAINPRGIFDRKTKGARLTPVRVDIERGRIRQFAEAIGETDPIHFDVEAARKAGHPDLVAPASYFMVVEALADEERVRKSQPSAMTLVNCDMRYLLHGDERYFYTGCLYAGDTVEFTTDVLDFYDKKGGTMEFVTFQSLVTHPKRGVLIRSRRTLLHRLPEAAA